MRTILFGRVCDVNPTPLYVVATTGNIFQLRIRQSRQRLYPWHTRAILRASGDTTAHTGMKQCNKYNFTLFSREN